MSEIAASPLQTSRVGVVIVAAGRGERAGLGDGPKQYRRIGGRPVLAHTLDAFLAHPMVDRIAVAIHPDDEALFAACDPLPQRVIAVHGGATRQDSTRIALEALREDAPPRVLIHDGVRPFVDRALIDRTLAAIGDRQGALPAL